MQSWRESISFFYFLPLPPPHFFFHFSFNICHGKVKRRFSFLCTFSVLNFTPGFLPSVRLISNDNALNIRNFTYPADVALFALPKGSHRLILIDSLQATMLFFSSTGISLVNLPSKQNIFWVNLRACKLKRNYGITVFTRR